MFRWLVPGVARGLFATLLACGVVSQGSAQNASAELRETPAIELTQEQRDTIYQSVSSARRNAAVPQGTHAVLGTEVPSTVELAPMPQIAARLVPEARDMQVAVVDKRVIVVEPSSRKIVAVIGFDEKHDQPR